MVQGVDAKRISVGPDGNAWIINSKSQIFQYDGESWKRQAGGASDIGVGGDGSLWVIGNSGAEENGRAIYHRRMNFESKWQRINGGATNISVDQSGMAYVTNSGGRIFIHNGKKWRVWSGRASDIGASPDGEFWVIGSGNTIWRWTGSSDAAHYKGNGGWRKVPGSAVRIALGPGNGNAYVCNKAGSIYNYVNNRWKQLPGKATDIGVGADGTVWVVGYGGGKNKNVFRYNRVENKWIKIGG